MQSSKNNHQNKQMSQACMLFKVPVQVAITISVAPQQVMSLSVYELQQIRSN